MDEQSLCHFLTFEVNSHYHYNNYYQEVSSKVVTNLMLRSFPTVEVLPACFNLSSL